MEKSMNTIDKIAFNLGIRNEEPNKELAKELSDTESKEGIDEITEYLFDKNKSIASDCIAVLYHIGYVKPQLIAEQVDTFLKLLTSKNNRMVWGSMIALSTIAHLKAQNIYESIDTIIETIDEGTVITEVWGLVLLSNLSKHDKRYKDQLFPVLCSYLQKCRPIDFAKRTETILPVIGTITERETLEVIIGEKVGELSDAQRKKLRTVIKKYNKSDCVTEELSVYDMS